MQRSSARPLAVGAIMMGMSGAATFFGWLAAKTGGFPWLATVGGMLVLSLIGVAAWKRLTFRWRQAEEFRWQVVHQAADQLRARATAVALAAGLLRQRGAVPMAPRGGQAAGSVATPAPGGADGRRTGDGPSPEGERGRIPPGGASPGAPIVAPWAGREGLGSPLGAGRVRQLNCRPAVPAPAQGILRGAEVPAPLPHLGASPSPRAHTFEDALRGQIWATLEGEAELLRVESWQLVQWLLLERGHRGGERERVDLAALAERVVRRLTPTAAARHAALRFLGAPGPAAVVKGDRALLELLCVTMVAAAVDRALPGSGVQVEVWGDGASVSLRVAGEASGLHRKGGGLRLRWEPESDLQAQLVRQIVRWHRGQWRETPDHPFCWQAVLPAAHGPLNLWPPVPLQKLRRRPGRCGRDGAGRGPAEAMSGRKDDGLGA